MPTSHSALEPDFSDRVVAFVDVAESVRLIEADEVSAVSRIRTLIYTTLQQRIADVGGRTVEMRGDGLLAEFDSARSAVSCAHQLHGDVRQGNVGRPIAEHILLRIGLHRARILAAESLFGHGVNLAARIAAGAVPGETWASDEVAGDVTDGIDAEIEDLGQHHLKHVARPKRLYRLIPPGTTDRRTALPFITARLKATVAVLPLSMPQGGGAIDIGDVIADRLISAISASDQLSVISRLSTRAVAGRDLLATQIAERLGADFIVSGSVTTSTSTVRGMIELCDARSGLATWSTRFAGPTASVLDRDGDLLGGLLRGISDAILATEVRRSRTDSLPTLASHTLLLSAVSRMYRLARDDFEQSKSLLTGLHERVPRHPAPLAWLARWHLFRVVQGWTDDRDADGALASQYANRALDLDPESSIALTMAGNVCTSYHRDPVAADRFYDRALASNPSESLAWLQKGNAMSFRGDGREAVRLVEKAIALSPVDPARHFYESLLASAALSAGDFERAVTAALASLRINADHVSSHRVLAIAYACAGRMDDARRAVAGVLQREPELTVRSFVARSPGGRSGLASKFGEALAAAGLPVK